MLPDIASEEEQARELSDTALRKASLALRYRAKSGESLDRLLPAAYGLVREAARRTVHMRHFDVQVLAGIAMHNESIVAMKTGEGKTLSATMPVYLNALTGEGSHVVTSNDYLASRDAEWMGPVYRALGLTVGSLPSGGERSERRTVYSYDVTYGTYAQFGFDFLADRLAVRGTNNSPRICDDGSPQETEDSSPVQRKLHFALVDEADSVLIDAASGSLTVNAGAAMDSHSDVHCYRWASEVARRLVNETDYEVDPLRGSVRLTSAGRRKVRTSPQSQNTGGVGLINLYRHAELAVKVNRDFVRDRQYILDHGEIVLLNERTGRPARHGSWSSGVQQAIQAREGVTITRTTDKAAQIAIQDLFTRYRKLAGMSGTLSGCESEMRRVYRCGTVAIPSHRPVIRERWPDRVLATQEEKCAAIVEEVTTLHAQGRPVLIGTNSIVNAERISKLLREHGVDHDVLHARHLAREAAIIARAGQRNMVTVATNMAGRGTDIKLGTGVAELGGLHVICCELHESSRLDWQLRGRCGRQGDPGTFRQYMALDDEILSIAFGETKADRIRKCPASSTTSRERLGRLFRRAQVAIERQRRIDREAFRKSTLNRIRRYREIGLDPYVDF